jgi:SnoaL-like protein
VQIVQRATEAWQRDDFEAWVALIHPDIEWHEAMRSRVEGEGSVFRGHEGMREFWTFWRTQVEDFQAEVKGDARSRWGPCSSAHEHPMAWTKQRRRAGRGARPHHDAAKREDRAVGGLPQPQGGPQSRGP